MRKHIRVVVTCLAALLACACARQVKPPATAQSSDAPSLELVVGAVHLALKRLATSSQLRDINAAYKENAKTCDEKKKLAKDRCADVQGDAIARACQCAGGSAAACLPAQPASCSAVVAFGAYECNIATTNANADAACRAVASRGEFVLKNADLSLSATVSTEGEGKLSLFIIGVSGSSTREQVQTVEMSLVPAEPAALSAAATNEFSKTITESLVQDAERALKLALQREFEMPGAEGKVPAVAVLKDMSVSIEFTAKKSGQGGVKWELAPISIEATRTNGHAGSSKVVLHYGIAE